MRIRTATSASSTATNNALVRSNFLIEVTALESNKFFIALGFLRTFLGLAIATSATFPLPGTAPSTLG